VKKRKPAAIGRIAGMSAEGKLDSLKERDAEWRLGKAKRERGADIWLELQRNDSKESRGILNSLGDNHLREELRFRG